MVLLDKSITFAFIFRRDMRVLQLGKFYPVQGGVEKVMVDLLTGFVEHGVPCDMLCAHLNQGKKTVEISPNHRIICTKTLFKKYATMVSPQMISVLRRIAPSYDIIHVHHPDPMAALALRLSGYKGKVVLHWHSDIVRQKKLLGLYLPLQEWLIRRADLIVGTTPVYLSSSDHLKGYLDKCTYLPIGIDPIVPDPEKVMAVRERYQGKRIIFSLGRLVHYKGFKYLVDAARYLDDDYVILIGGSGALREELLLQIAENHLDNRVFLLGRVSDEDLPSYYGACDLFCLSSVQKTEAFAIVQIESMSCGKPVVSCNIEGSGVPWVNADGVSGLVVETENGKTLAEAIRRIIESPDLYASLSEGAKQRFSQLFVKEKMIGGCYAIYQQVLGM